jgi:hypothetical protein
MVSYVLKLSSVNEIVSLYEICQGYNPGIREEFVLLYEICRGN